MNMHEFCHEVGCICEKQYGIEDGSDLCFNLVESGVIEMAQGLDTAAQIVAQHIEQA
jgi:hypothetical protein